MFDIGFTELLVIGVVALLVIGPERMPKVARTAGHLFGRFQRYVSAVKADIGREVELDELRKAGQTFKESVEQAASGVQTGVAEAEFTMKDEAESHIQRVTQAMADLEQHDPLLSPEAEELRAIPEPAAEMPGSQAELALDPPPPSESTGEPVGESAGEPATDNSAEKPA